MKSRSPRPFAHSMRQRLSLAGVLMLAAVVVLAVVAGLAHITRAHRPAPLDQTLTTRFPVLAESTASRSTEFTPTVRQVGGPDVAGLTLSRGCQVKAAVDSDSPRAMPAGLKPVEQEALRSMAERDRFAHYCSLFSHGDTLAEWESPRHWWTRLRRRPSHQRGVV
jgi:hypothetical protein